MTTCNTCGLDGGAHRDGCPSQWTQLEETQAGIIERERSALSRLADMYAEMVKANAEVVKLNGDIRDELDTACQLIGKVRGMIALNAAPLEIANVIDAWITMEPTNAP